MRWILGATNTSKLADACGKSPTWVCRKVFEQTHNSGLAKTADNLLDKPLHVFAILVGAWILIWISRIVVTRAIRGFTKVTNFATAGISAEEAQARRAQRSTALTSLARSAVAGGIGTIAVFWSLDVIGVDITPIVLGASFVGAALGFGAQQPVRDCLTGIFFLVEDQFGVGDEIEIDQIKGHVQSVHIRTTRICDKNGTIWHIANGDIKAVGNHSQGTER